VITTTSMAVQPLLSVTKRVYEILSSGVLIGSGQLIS